MGKLFCWKVQRSRAPSPGTRVLVTGASSGIGQEIAVQYAKRDYRLVLTSRSQEQLEKTVSKCRSLGCKDVISISSDATSEESCKVLMASAIEFLGGLDILVLCAGVAAYQLFRDAPNLEAYKKLMQTNYFGYLHYTFYAFKHLVQSHGQILVISSISGEIGLPYRSAYCASKFAVTGLFEALRSEINHGEVAITIVCPPTVRTNLRANSLVQIENSGSTESFKIGIEECVRKILAASDQRVRKIYFPFRVYLAAYCRPFFPDFVDRLLKRGSKL